VSPLLLRRLSDESLGRRLASGEAAAFDELYRRYIHRLTAYGAQVLGDTASADDVAQATMIRAYGALRGGRVPEHVKPWLYRIAHNCAVDLVARRRDLPMAGLPDRPAADGEAAGELVAALAALPDRQRHVFVLRELHGMRIDETASELDLAPAQVEQALFAARNRLAELLVFGERLSCVAVRRLAAGSLDSEERRALKTHLRSCPACRESVGCTGRVLGLLPAGAAGWIRALPGLLAGGGAPAAVKVGAVVATATLATGGPIVYEVARSPKPHLVAARVVVHPRPVNHAPSAPIESPRRRAVVSIRREPASAVSHPAPRASSVERVHAAAVSEGRKAPTVSRKTAPVAVTERDHGDDGADSQERTAPAVVAAPTPTAITSSQGSDEAAETGSVTVAASQSDGADGGHGPAGGAGGQDWGDSQRHDDTTGMPPPGDGGSGGPSATGSGTGSGGGSDAAGGGGPNSGSGSDAGGDGGSDSHSGGDSTSTSGSPGD
jgi:RNA polymerase sigma factor (sigma-70 family)